MYRDQEIGVRGLISAKLSSSVTSSNVEQSDGIYSDLILITQLLQFPGRSETFHTTACFSRMSTVVDEYRQSNALQGNGYIGDYATTKKKALKEGADTIFTGQQANDMVTMAPVYGKEMETTTVQKMLAATSGSLLSSLLGRLLLIA